MSDRRIFKYEITLGLNKLSIPGKGMVVSAGLDPDGILCAWAEAFPSDEEQENLIHVYFTGEEVHPSDEHITTVIGRSLVFHIYGANLR